MSTVRRTWGLHHDAPPVPPGMRPRPGVVYGCGSPGCLVCYAPDHATHPTDRSEDHVWPLDVWPPEDRDDRPGVEYIRADLHAAEIARLTRELEEAREALRPFVDAAWWLAATEADDEPVTVRSLTAGDFRRAERALATPPAEGGGDE